VPFILVCLAKSDGRLTKNALRYQAENAGTAGRPRLHAVITNVTDKQSAGEDACGPSTCAQ
jgi:propanediol dehydratase small subunit